MANVDELTQGLDQLRDSIAQTAQSAPELARQEIHREGRAYFRGAVVAAVITSLLVGIPLALLAERFTEYKIANDVRAAQFQASEAETRRLAQGAYDLGAEANAELARRGLQTVPIPPPGTASDSQVLAAASIAQVAAKIAGESIVVPTPVQIRDEVAAQLAKLPAPPVGPTSAQLTEAVQAYLTANADSLRGPRGERGEPGQSPSCLTDPAQCQGAPGSQGLRGEPPVSWTVTDTDGSVTTCQRVENFDPTAPRYRCSRGASSPSSTPTTTSTPPPSEDGVLPVPG